MVNRETQKGTDATFAVDERMALYLDAVTDRKFRHPWERDGQAHFNALWYDQHDAKFADFIRGGQLDPFHDDGRIPAMLAELRKWWAAE